MKIKTAKINNCRNIRDCELVFDSNCTVVAGDNGSGKTSVRQAIQTALFGLQGRKKGSHVSRFDPDAVPTTSLELHIDSDEAEATLERSLIDKSGKWTSGTITSRAKGKALQLSEIGLGIPSAAADLLLCGNHQNFSHLLEEFPDDMQSLLTASCVKGSGPDPKAVIAKLEKDWKSSKTKSAKAPGVITVLNSRLASLQSELQAAQAEIEKAKILQANHKTCSHRREELAGILKQGRSQLAALRNLSESIASVSEHESRLERHQELQAQWNALSGKIEKAERTCKLIEAELDVLNAQFRVKRSSELEVERLGLRSKLESCRVLKSKTEGVKKKILNRKRPAAHDVEKFRRVESKLEQLCCKLQATGVRLELLSKSSIDVQIEADGNLPTKKQIAPNNPFADVVGAVQIHVGDLTIRAEGKEDIRAIKQAQLEAEKIQQELYEEFGVSKPSEFEGLHHESNELQQERDELETELRHSLDGKTFPELESMLERMQLEQTGLNEGLTIAKMTPVHMSSVEIEKLIIAKTTELQSAKSLTRELRIEQPTDSDKRLSSAKLLEDSNKLAVAKADMKKAADASSLQEGVERSSVENRLAELTESVRSSQNEMARTETELVRIEKDLEHLGKLRRPAEIQTTLAEVTKELEKEDTKQQARILLIERIQGKYIELSQSVPVELAESVAKHLEHLSSGLYANVKLRPDFTVDSVQQMNGTVGLSWDSDDLSTGERVLIALALRAAIAVAIADLKGSSFLMLDDSFTNLDSDHTAQVEELLEQLTNDGRVQVILFTCRTKWAQHWSASSENVKTIRLSDSVDYFVDRNAHLAVPVST